MTMTPETMTGMINFNFLTAAIWILMLLIWFLQAGLAGSLARQKGYAGTPAFFIALLLPGLGLIYEAGRPISQEMEDERQRSLAIRIAKAIRKSEQAQEKVFHSEEEDKPARRPFPKR